MRDWLWLIPALPLAGFVVLALAGFRMPRRAIATIAVAAVALAAVGRRRRRGVVHRGAAGRARLDANAVALVHRRRLHADHRLPSGRAVAGHGGRGRRRGAAHPRLRLGVDGEGRGLRALLRLHEPVRRLDAARCSSPTTCSSCTSAGRASACAAISSSASGTRTRPTGAPRRRRSSSRASATSRSRSRSSSCSRASARSTWPQIGVRAPQTWTAGRRRGARGGAPAPRRRGRQVGAAAAPDVAARRDGRPDARSPR